MPPPPFVDSEVQQLLVPTEGEPLKVLATSLGMVVSDVLSDCKDAIYV